MTTIALNAAAAFAMLVALFFAFAFGVNYENPKYTTYQRRVSVISISAGILALFFAYQAGVARWPSGMPMDDPPPRV